MATPDYLPPLAGEGGAKRRMGVAGATTPIVVTDRYTGTPIRPSGTFPRRAGEGRRLRHA